MTINELNQFMSEHGFFNTYNNEDLPKKYVADLVEFAIEEGINLLKNRVCLHFADWRYSESNKFIRDIIELASESVEEIADKLLSSDEKPKVGEWIPCSERLPDKEGMYLITARVYDRTEVQYVFYQENLELFICNGVAIAWMPLPEAYKEDNDD